MTHINFFFDKYDEGNKGWLTIYEAKAFFAYILNFTYSLKSDRTKFKSIMGVADPENAKILLKHRVMEFFKMGGFLHLTELGQEQKKMVSEHLSDSDESWAYEQQIHDVRKRGAAY